MTGCNDATETMAKLMIDKFLILVYNEVNRNKMKKEDLFSLLRHDYED